MQPKISIFFLLSKSFITQWKNVIFIKRLAVKNLDEKFQVLADEVFCGYGWYWVIVAGCG